jgi:hypothetical protein
MDAIKEIEGDWRKNKWNIVAKSVGEARTDAQSCLSDLKSAMRAYPTPAAVRGAVDMLELYQRILFNTLDANDQLIAARDAEIERLRKDVEVEKMLRQEAQDFHRAAMLDAYRLLGIDASDGEIRYKWVALEIASLKRRAALNPTQGANK